MLSIFVLVFITSSALGAQSVSALNDPLYVIDLSTGSPIEETEALIKQSFALWEQMIMWATGNASALAEKPVPGSVISISIGNVMTRAFINRPIFRLPATTTSSQPNRQVTSESRSMAPLCGAEIQQLACKLISLFNDGRVFLSPFDLDELVYKDRQGSTPWHRNSPLVSMVRLCAGFKASTKYESAETCIGSIILEKITALVNAYSEMQSNTGNNVRSNRILAALAPIISYGDRYLTIKAILTNFGYANQGTAAEHSTGNAVDILCGPSAGLDSGAEKNCTVVRQLCQTETSTSIVSPAESTGCGAVKSPLTSVHCAFFHRPIINLANVTAKQATDAIRQHYAPFEQETQTAIKEVVSNTVKTAIEKNLSVAEAVEIVKVKMVPKMNTILKEASENGIVFNVSSMPRRGYPIQFKRIGFRLGPGSNAIDDDSLTRNTRAAADQSGLQCPLESVEMAKRLLDMNSVGERIFILPNIFSKYTLSSIIASVSAGMTKAAPQTSTDDSGTSSSSQIMTDALGRRAVIPSAKTAFRVNHQGADTTTTMATTTEGPESESRSPAALENIVRMSFGLKAINGDGNLTCISYEALNGIFTLANSFYSRHQQPIYIASLTATAFHTSNEAMTHTSGLAVDSLCGPIYRKNSGSGSVTGEQAKLYCSELMSGCFSTKMFTRVMQAGTETGGAGCLADSILSMYGVVHCRSREIPTTSQ